MLIAEERFPGRQGRLLFAYLVAEQGRPLTRDELADAIWRDAPPATWANALTVVVSKLRGFLAECGVIDADALTSAFGCYRLDLPEGTWVDVIAAADAAREAEAALAADDLERARALATRAASIARRPFLPGEEGAWVDGKRRELADVLRRALACLSDACLLSGDEAEAAKWAEEMTVLEPYRETGYRRLMQAHAAAGNRAEALRVYERCRRLLAKELGAYPSPETESIYRELLGSPSSADRAAAPESISAAPTEGESEERAQAPPLLRRRSRRTLAGIAAAVLVGAAIAVPVALLTGGRNQTVGFAAANSLAAVDLKTNRLVADVPVGAGPTSVAADGEAVWVTNTDDHTVSRIDLRTNTQRQTVPVGGGPSAVAVGADAVWVANGLDGTVSRIDPKTNEVVQTITVGNTPTAVAFGAGAVWAANAHDRTVSKLDPASGDVVRVIPVDAPASGIAVGGGAVWLSDPVAGELVRLDARTHVVTRVTVGSGPTAVAFGGGAVWVANNLDGTVSRVDAVRAVVTDTVQVGVAPNGIAVTPDAVWVTDEAAGTLVRIDPRSREPTTRRRLGGRPEGLAFAEGSLWVAVQAGAGAHRGGTLRLLVSAGAVESIDPARAYLPFSWNLQSVTGDGLVGFKRVGGADGNTLVPDLATKLPLATDGGRTYTFQLRERLRFSDGRPVKASRVRYTFERLFEAGVPRPDYYDGIVGGAACRKRPKRCDLSRGIVSDDASRTVTFHLRAPDPEFLYKLALPFAALVPAGAPATGDDPVPGTGPYRVARYEPKRLVRLVRNPYFRVWSTAAQPAANPDAIEIRFASDESEQVTAVERGRADWTPAVPDDRLGEVRTRYAAQTHITPRALTVFVQLNATRPPFNDVLARRAVSYALERRRIVELVGGSDLAAPTCQILPPNSPGYRPYCPYTAGFKRGASTAPDLARARELVRRSGTRGARVDILDTTGKNVYTAGMTVFADTVRQLGYRVSVSNVPFGRPYLAAYDRGARRLEAAGNGWQGDYPAPSNFIASLFGCNPYFCDHAFERRMRRARALQTRDARAANRLWTRLERELVDRAIVVPLVNPKQIDFVSKRVGNYQHHPVFGILISQLWVR